jgi:hypothetical protein
MFAQSWFPLVPLKPCALQESGCRYAHEQTNGEEHNSEDENDEEENDKSMTRKKHHGHLDGRHIHHNYFKYNRLKSLSYLRTGQREIGVSKAIWFCVLVWFCHKIMIAGVSCILNL